MGKNKQEMISPEQWLSTGSDFVPTGNTEQRLETFWIVTMEGGGVCASCWQLVGRGRGHCSTSYTHRTVPFPQHRIIRPQMSIEQRLRNTDREDVCDALHGPKSVTGWRGAGEHTPQDAAWSTEGEPGACPVWIIHRAWSS